MTVVKVKKFLDSAKSTNASDIPAFWYSPKDSEDDV
jgi:hypothetical protein